MAATKIGEANPMLLKLARAAFDRGWIGAYETLFELDMWLSGLGGAGRRLRRQRQRRQSAPRVSTWMREANVDG
jgi:hypothetical protein